VRSAIKRKIGRAVRVICGLLSARWNFYDRRFLIWNQNAFKPDTYWSCVNQFAPEPRFM
jgi:hypothetical protein